MVQCLANGRKVLLMTDPSDASEVLHMRVA